MPADQIDAFMRAIGTLESGNNYDARGVYTGPTYGRALGRYQIMQTIYPGWAREAGVDPNDLSPAAQDRVARHKMMQYYRKYGRWDLVAVAWFAGPGRADKAARSGISSVGGLKDVLGTSVAGYVDKTMNLMGKVGGKDWPSAADAGLPGMTRQKAPSADEQIQAVSDAASGEVQPEPPTQVEIDQESASSLADIMSFISQAARERGGGQVLDMKMLLGETLEGYGRE